MQALTKQYETAKSNAYLFMKNGNVTAYFNALLEMKKYKNLITAVISN